MKMQRAAWKIVIQAARECVLTVAAFNVLVEIR